jgi:hypothetical protein
MRATTFGQAANKIMQTDDGRRPFGDALRYQDAL